MQLSLRARILLLVTAVNTVVFGLGFLFFLNAGRGDRQRAALETCDALGYMLSQLIVPRGEVRVASLLRSPSWHYFQDAVLVRDSFTRGPNGEYLPAGAWINPMGRASRPASFDEAAILGDVVRAIRERTRIESHGGLALPVLDSEGEVWGGCWLLPDTTVDTAEIFRRLAGWFLVSTAVLTVGTFLALRRFVLEPVEELAGGARRLAQGELSTRLAVPARHDELAELIRGFNQMAETVEGFNARLAHEVEVATENARRAENAAMTQRRLAATGELAAGIAHEVNNPLGGLLNAVEALEKKELTPEKRVQYLGLLKHGLERIQRTVGQLLRFTPRGRSTVPLALVDPVLDAYGLVAWRARKLGVVVVLQGEDLADARSASAVAHARALPPIEGDPAELAQAVLNLLVNALDALEDHRKSAPGGRIDLAIERRGTELAVVVQDDGPGVPEALLPRVADLFFTTKEVGKGTGLGLSIVHNAVTAHGGRVLLSNAPAGGLRVELLFPIVAPGAGAKDGAP